MIDRRPETSPPAESPPSGDPAGLTPDVLGQLQAAVIDAVRSGRPLEGHSRALTMPDLAGPAAQAQLILSSENLGGPLALKQQGSATLHILPRHAIQERAQRQGALPYLHFESPQHVKDGVRLTLQLRTAQPGSEPSSDLGMSTVQVTFQHGAQGWRALDDTAAMSA